MAGEDDLAVLPQGVLDALGPAVLLGRQGCGMGGLGQGVLRCPGRQDTEGEGQRSGQEQGSHSFHV